MDNFTSPIQVKFEKLFTIKLYIFVPINNMIVIYVKYGVISSTLMNHWLIIVSSFISFEFLLL